MKLKDHTLENYLKKLSSTQPAPGGGSASALVAASGIALGEMVASILLNRKGNASKKSELKKLKARFRKTQNTVRRIIDQDAKAFERVMKAYGTKKKGTARKEVIDKALENAYQMMADLCMLLKASKKDFNRLEKTGNTIHYE